MAQGCVRHHGRTYSAASFFNAPLPQSGLGFSKKLGNLKAAVALHVFHDNFCRIHSSIRCTPAMRPNLTDHIGKLDELFA